MSLTCICCYINGECRSQQRLMFYSADIFHVLVDSFYLLWNFLHSYSCEYKSQFLLQIKKGKIK